MPSFYPLWLSALVRRQLPRLLGTALGIAFAVGLLGSLAGFFADAEALMTRQAIANVAVDWQIQLSASTDPAAAINALEQSPGATNAVPVGYFDTPGMQAITGSTVQTTGAGKVLGLGNGYRDAFPAEIRDLVGQGQVLLAQQTAANLHAAPGSVISIARPGLPDAQVTVDAVVDLPLADSLFQVIGAPAGSAPNAPPDNVLLLPLDQWHLLFDPVVATAPEALHLQIHATIPHTLPSAPTAAYNQVVRTANNYESRLAGGATIGNNLAARLDTTRSDYLYARVLFLFLGLPGAILASLLTAVIASTAATRRRREQALLRLRGASARTLLGAVAAEALITGLLGSALGLLGAIVAIRLSLGRWSFGNGTRSALIWGGVTAAIGLLLALATVLAPAWQAMRRSTVVTARRVIGRDSGRWWERTGLDFILIAVAGIVYWRAKSNGYQIVVAPEGTPSVAVSYISFIAPLLLWLGASLLALRLVRLLLARGGCFVIPLLRPRSGQLARLVGASLSRQRQRIALGVTILVLAIAFASSTAIFNATYRAQARVDAELSNGADVTLSATQGYDTGAQSDSIANLPGVAAVAAMQHRFAYVGNDLQDLYGIDPVTLSNATTLSDAFFVGGTAKDVMAKLAQTPDGVIVSPETVLDYQLQPGDTIRLRLKLAGNGEYQAVTFHYVGIAREFPTAPSDSFLVANAAYISQQTGSTAVETVLVKTSGTPATVATTIRDLLGPAAPVTVRDIDEQQHAVDSSITSVSLRGLTRIELLFAVLLAVAGGGLVLALGLEERRRTLAIASALGANSKQLGSFVWSETMLILIGGLAGGGLLGWGISHMLIKLLTQVFDPPPSTATVPWTYLLLVGVATLLALVVAAGGTIRAGQRAILTTLRRLGS